MHFELHLKFPELTSACLTSSYTQNVYFNYLESSSEFVELISLYFYDKLHLEFAELTSAYLASSYTWNIPFNKITLSYPRSPLS